MTRIIGIDPGLVNTGYGIVEHSGASFKAVEGGVVTTRSSDPLERRLQQIHAGLKAVVDRFAPDEMALENLFSRAQFVKTAILMGHARGVAMLTAGQAGVPVHEYQPTFAKRMVSGFGRASKEQIQLAIHTHIPNLPLIKNEHIADGYSLAICHGLTRNSPAVGAA